MEVTDGMSKSTFSVVGAESQTGVHPEGRGGKTQELDAFFKEFHCLRKAKTLWLSLQGSCGQYFNM